MTKKDDPKIPTPDLKKKVFPEETIERMEFSPQDARMALATTHENRPIRIPDVNKYRRDMEHGSFKSSDIIKFDWHGRLVDGQHRLTAQADAGLTMSWWVLKGVDPEVKEYQNFGAANSPKDQLAMLGFQNTANLAAVARLGFMWEEEKLATGRFKPSIQEIVHFIREHPDLERSVEISLQARRYTALAMQPSIIGAAHWIIAQKAGFGPATEFIEKCIKGTNIPEGSPILALQRRAQDIWLNKKTVNTRDRLALIIRTWNYMVEGREIQRLMTYEKGGWRHPMPLSPGDETNERGDMSYDQYTSPKPTEEELEKEEQEAAEEAS